MWLKREYDENGNVTGVIVSQASRFQNFSKGLVDEGIGGGWLSTQRGKIILHGSKGDVPFTVLRGPGTYCCTCGEMLPEGTTAAAAAANIEHTSAHGPSPDPTNPAGYRTDNFFACALDGGEIDNLTKEEKLSLRDAVRAKVVSRLGEKHISKSVL